MLAHRAYMCTPYLSAAAVGVISPPCAGHGSCVGHNGQNTPMPATCFCNPGWLGVDCSVQRFPDPNDFPLLEVLSPANNVVVGGANDTTVTSISLVSVEFSIE